MTEEELDALYQRAVTLSKEQYANKNKSKAYLDKLSFVCSMGLLYKPVNGCLGFSSYCPMYQCKFELEKTKTTYTDSPGQSTTFVYYKCPSCDYEWCSATGDYSGVGA